MERDAANNIWTIWYASQYGKLERVRSLLDRNAVSSIDVQELKRVLEARELYAQCLPHAENLFGGADDHTVACTDALGKCCFLLGQFAVRDCYKDIAILDVLLVEPAIQPFDTQAEQSNMSEKAPQVLGGTRPNVDERFHLNDVDEENKAPAPSIYALQAEDDVPEVTTMESLCMNCHEDGTTKLLLTMIPYFREVILMSFECEHCGFKNSEVQFGGKVQEQGAKIELELTTQEVRTAAIAVRYIKQHQHHRRCAAESIEDLRENQEHRREIDPETTEKIDEFIAKLALMSAGITLPFTVVLDDPSGNSHIENPHAPAVDPKMKVTHYYRSEQQDLDCGLQPDMSHDAPSQAPRVLPHRNEGLDKFVEEANIAKKEVIQIPANCFACQAPGFSCMCMTDIPHFKEVIIMAFNCEACGFKTNEVKAGGAIPPQGERITLKVDPIKTRMSWIAISSRLTQRVSTSPRLSWRWHTLIDDMVAQQGASTAHDAGITGHGVLTMEEKLQRWKQAKSDQQKSVHHRRNSVAVIKQDTVGNISRSGVVKRKVAGHSRTTTSRSPDMYRSRFPAPKKSRYSEVIRHTAPRSSPVATKLAAIKRVAAPKSAPKALGSVLLPILIEDTSEPSPVESEKPAPSQQDRGANTALEKKNHAEPSQKLPAPIKKVLTPRNKDLPKQILKPVPAPLNLNARDLPIATTQPLSDPRPTAKSPSGWNAHPALDKENQAEVLGLRIQILPAPVITVEKKPGSLPKILSKSQLASRTGIEWLQLSLPSIRQNPSSYTKIRLTMAWQLQEQEEARRLHALLQQQQQEEQEARQLRVGLRQHGAPRWEDVRTDASFVERSRRRKPGAMKAQERYLRRDIHCGVASCSTCRQARALVPPQVLPGVQDGEYVVPDAFSLLQCMELLEEETLFCRAAPRLLVLENVLQSALRLAPSRDASRLRKFFRGEDQRTGGGVSVYLFPNQHHIDTFVEPRAMDELQTLRDDRAVLKTVEWYVTQSHLPPQAKVVFMTRDVDTPVSVQLAASVNAQAVTCETFLSERLPQHSADTAFLLELAANTAEAVRYEEMQRLPDENGNVIGSQAEFAPHLKPAQLDEALAHPSSWILAGKLEVSSHNPMEAYVLVEGPHAVERVFVFGRAAMNRGVHGDRVAVEMLSKAHWRAPQSDRLLVHYTQDEEREHESESVESEVDEQESGAIPTGQVVGILSRSPRYHVATVIASTVNAGDDYALAVPMDQRLPKVRIRSQRLDALLDKRLKVVIDSWATDSSYPNGHYVGILGAPGSLQTELSALLVDNEVEEAPFSEAALACLPSSDECPIDIEGGCVAECSTAKRPARCGLLNWKIPEEEALRRRDLRRTHRVFSVDPHGCQDIDDAMSIRRLPNGNVELGVHIADVSYFVEHGSALDLEGRRRGTTVYLVGQRLDMLPSVLSADLCSLHENRDRFAVSVMCELDGETYDVVENSTWFGRTIIRNCSSMTYEQAHRLLQGVNADVDDSPRCGSARSQPPMDEHVEGVAGGRIPLQLQQDIREDLRIITDVGRRLALGQEDVEITVKESLEIHGTIAELMIFANSTVARRLVERFPTHALLRRHPPPSGDRFTQLVQLAKARDVVIDATNNFTLQQSLAAAERSGRMDSKTMSLLKSLAVRVMTEAEYVSSGAVAAGDAATANGDVTRFAHYGLGLQYYTHFTSPIRRYADVIVHRQLLASIAAPSPLKSGSRRSTSIAAPLVLPTTLVPSVLETEDDEDFLDDLISSVDSQLQVATAPAQEVAVDEAIMDGDSLFPPEELVPLARHLNKKNRQAKLAAHACDALFLALYFSSHTVKVPAIITALKQNGFIVYVPKYDLRAPVYLRDKSGVVQIDPLLLGVRMVDTDPATGAFAGAECIRRIPQAQLIWDDSDRETLQVAATEDKRTVFHILDEVEVQVSCDLTASGARVPQLQLLLVGRASATRKKHIASSLSELQRVVQTKSEADNDPISKKANVSEPSTVDEFSASNLYQLLNAPTFLHQRVSHDGNQRKRKKRRRNLDLNVEDRTFSVRELLNQFAPSLSAQTRSIHG
ncbi:DIS3-like exonuclease 1 [Phytophthora cactorum]|nr:DIS3-like exonuclease 1 [Phytophthora cactorum]